MDFHHQVDRLFRSFDQFLGTTGGNSDDAQLRLPEPPLRSGFDDRPAIAVLPFTCPNLDPEHQRFADSITDDIITELASWRSFPVIARCSTFAFRHSAFDVRQLSKELGARYFLEGTVARRRDQLRITVKLIDASNGYYVLSGRYERDIDELFELQDEIVEMIGGSIAPELLRNYRDRSSRHENPTSYELPIQARQGNDGNLPFSRR